VQSGNTVFKTFAKEEQSVQSTLRLLPGALGKARQGWQARHGRARARPDAEGAAAVRQGARPAEEASQVMFTKVTPIVKTQIRPFARQICPSSTSCSPTPGN